MERKLRNQRKIMNEKEKDEKKSRFNGKKEKKMNKKKVLFMLMTCIFLMYSTAFVTTANAQVPLSTGIQGFVDLYQGSGNVLEVVVTLYQDGSYVDHTNPSDLGNFDFVCAAGTYDLEFVLADYRTEELNDVVVVEDEITTVGHIIMYYLLNSISGTVTLTAGSGDVTDVEIRAIYQYGMKQEVITNPDSNGEYILSGLSVGFWNVTATLESYIANPDTIFNVEVTDGGQNQGNNFNMNPIPGRITGMITLNGGHGDITLVDVSADVVTVNPDTTGFYEIELQLGTYDVTATLGDYDSATYPDVIVVENVITPDIDLNLDPMPASISGTVTLNGGSGDVTQVTVYTTVGGTTYEASPNANGDYLIASIDLTGITTPYVVEVTADLENYYPSSLNVDLYENQLTPDINIILDPLPATISGHISLINGNGNGNIVDVLFYDENLDIGAPTFSEVSQDSLSAYYTIEIDLSGHNTPVDAQIHAELHGYQNSEYLWVSLEENMVHEALPLHLVYIPYGTIEGIVTVNGGPSTPEDVTLSVFNSEGDPVQPNQIDGPYTDGTYSIDIIIGVYSIVASLPGYTSDTVDSIEVFEDEILPDINFTLEYSVPAGTIAGNVVVEPPGVVTDVEVTADGYPPVNPDINGDYEIIVQPGTYTVTAELTGYYPDTVEDVVVVSEETTPVDFSLGIACTISGTVFFSAKGNLEEVYVELWDAEMQTLLDSKFADINGDFEFTAGTSNSYVIRASLIGYSIELYPFNILEGTPNYDIPDDKLILKVLPSGFVIGEVNTDDGTDIQGVTLELANTIYNPVYGTLEYPWDEIGQPDGTYEVEVFIPLDETSTTLRMSAVNEFNVLADPDTVDVVVYKDSIAADKDFAFNPSIYGTVALNGGHGLVTDVQISSNGYTVNPDLTGYYFFPAFANGGYLVTATLPDYVDFDGTATVPLTAPFDITLDPLPASISGTVTLNGGCGNLEEVVVSAAGVSDTCDVDGNYELTIDMVGQAIPYNITVTATNPNYDPVSFTIDDIMENDNYDVDFTLDTKPGWIAGNIKLIGGGGISLLPLPDSTLNLWVGHVDDPMQLHTTIRPLSGYFFDYITDDIFVDDFFPPDNKFNLAGQVWGYVFDNTVPNIDSIDVCNNETTAAQDFTLESVKIKAITTIDDGFGPIDAVEFLVVETATGDTILPDSIAYVAGAQDSAQYWIDVNPGIYDVTATLLGYSGDYKSITQQQVELPDNQHVDIEFNFILNNPIIEDFFISQNAKDNLQSVYHWIKEDGAEPEAFIAPELHAIIQGSPAALLDTILFEYQDTNFDWIEIGVIEQPVPTGIIYDVSVDWNPLPAVGNYPIRVRCWDVTVTKSNPDTMIINRDVRDVTIEPNNCSLTDSLETIGPNAGKRIIHNSIAEITIEAEGTVIDLSEVDSLKVYINEVGGGNLYTQTSVQPFDADSVYSWNFAHLIDDILINAGEDPDDGKVNVDFNVTLYDTTGANWVWYETPLFDDIWIDKEDPYLPDYDKITIKAGGNPVDITDLLLPANSSIEVKIDDCHDFDLTHIDNVDLLNFFPGYLDIDDGDFEIVPVNETITLTFNTEYEDVYWFEFTILVDDWINNNSTTKTYRFISEDLLAQMDACNIEDPIHPPVEWTDHLERDYDYRVSATGVLDYVVGVDFYHQRPSGGSGAWTFIGSDDDAPYNVENPSYESSETPSELFEHNKYYDFIGLSTIYNTVDGDRQLTVDDIKGSAIYEVDFDNTWDNFRNAGYVKHIRYKDDSTHNLPDLYIEGLFGDPGEIIQIGPDEYVLNKEICGEWLDEVRLDPNTIPWDVRFPYEYDPYGVGKVQYYYHQDGFTTDSLIATVIDPTGLDFNLYTWNISMLNEGVYEIYALGIDNVNNTQTTINSITLTIVETADVWIEALAGKSIEAIYYDENTLHGEVSITAKSDGTIDGFRFYTSPDGHTWELLPDGIVELLPPDSVCTYQYWDVTELTDGSYWVGATSLENLEPPVYGVQITIDNTLDLSLTEQSIADNDILGDSTDIVLKHDPAITDLADLVRVRYKNMHPDSVWRAELDTTWNEEGIVSGILDSTVPGGIPNWNDGFYEFEIIAWDKAIPDANCDTLMFANNIRFDSASPIIEEFTVNELEWTDPADPLPISVEEPTTFRLLANDQYESGIVHAMITLLYNGPQGEEIVLLDKDYASVDYIEESVTEDLSGYPLGDYTITITLSDVVNTEEYEYALILLSEEMIPKPFIAGFDFKVDPHCKDKIYAYTKGCYLPDGTQIPATGVRFEYKDDGGVWTDMGTTGVNVFVSASGLEKLWMVKYNVDTITEVRTISYLELVDTTYSQIGDPVNPADYTADSPMTAISLRIVADDVAKVESINPVDFITALAEKIDGTDNVANDEVEIIDISANNNVYVGDITQANPGWIGEENGMVTLWMHSEVDGLTYTQFDVHKVTQSYGTNGVVSSYDDQMTANVPANAVTDDAAIYFEPNENDIPDPDTLHTRVSVIENVYYNGALPPVPDEMVVYTLKYDCPEVPTGAALEIHRYDEALNVWQIIDNPIFDGTEAEFTVPAGDNIFAVFLNTEGVLDLAVSDITLEPGYENYTTPTQNFVTTITYAGSRADLLVDVMLDDYYVIYESVPGNPGCGMTLDWCGIDEINHILTIENTNIELDPSVEHTIEITVKDVYGNEDSNNLTFSIDDEAPIVSNDVYEGLTFSAEITDALTEVEDVVLEVAGLVKTLDQITVAGDTYSYTFGYSELLIALPGPYGNLTANWWVEDKLENDADYEYTYEYDLSYSITFNPFNGTYWFNPDYSNEFTFNIDVPEGVEIANNGVFVDFLIDGNLVQEHTMATDLGDGLYSVHFGASCPDSCETLTIKADVTTTDTTPFSAQQNYGIDILSPEITSFVLPDLLVELGEDINISVSYSDGQSGIDLDNVVVYLNGTPVDAIVTEGNVMCNLDITEIGNYTLVVSIPDMVGNIATYEYAFVVGVTPTISVNAFAGGYWFNPAQNDLPFTFSVKTEDGEAIPGCDVTVNFIEQPSGLILQGPINPPGDEGEYEVYFGGSLSPEGIAVKMHVTADCGFPNPTIYTQSFSVDYASPVVWAISPIGDPIDNDNDGLFNEDPPGNGNDDQDWDDINGNGIRDMYQVSDTLWVWEPWKIDEDPMDFYPDEIPYGTDVVISVGFNDIPRYVTYVSPGDTITYYSAASGIDTTGIQLLVNGIPQNGLIISNGILTYAAGVMEAGHYFINVFIPDNAGNIGSFNADYFNSWQFEFDVTAPAPSVTFQPLLVGNAETWVVDPYDDMENVFRFAINWKGNPEIVPNEVVVTYYEQGSETILDGPRTIESTSIDSTIANYTDNLGSNVIDELTTGIILEVKATNIWNGITTSRHTYMIMHSPELLFAKPNEMIFSSNPLRLNDGAKGTSSFNLALTRDAYVTIEIYNFAGKKVKVLKSNELIKRLTNNPVSWDGTNNNGNEVARGGYVTRIVATGVSGDVKGKTITKMLKIGVLK